MTHGVGYYFRERWLNRRRVAFATLVLHAVVLALLLLTQVPVIRALLTKPLPRMVRIGYPGPNRFVEQIILARPGDSEAPLRDIGKVDAIAARKGGAGSTPSPDADSHPNDRVFHVAGVGDNEYDMIARARARRPSVPMVQSEDLGILNMVDPVYPEELREQGIEGRVALMALIDTSGQVSEVTLVSGSGFVAFERAAIVAVRESRFQPYRELGVPREVYALIRYRFRID